MKKILLIIILLMSTQAWGAKAVYTVQASGGDYTNFLSALALDTSISANDTVWFDIYLSGTDSITAASDFTGWSPDTSSYIIFNVVDSVRHKGVADETNAYMLVLGTSTSGIYNYFPSMTPANAGCHLVWNGFQFRSSSASGSFQFMRVINVGGPHHITMNDCIMFNTNGTGRLHSNINGVQSLTVTANNCLFYGMTNVVSNADTDYEIEFNHCTMADMTFMVTGTATMVVSATNTVSVDASDSCYNLPSGGTYTFNYCVADDSSVTAYSGANNKPKNTGITFRDSANGVWLLAVSDTACQGAGDDLTATIPNDVQGEARSTNADIGFDEVYYGGTFTVATDDIELSYYQSGDIGTNIRNYGAATTCGTGLTSGFPDNYFHTVLGLRNLADSMAGVSLADQIDSMFFQLNVVYVIHSGESSCLVVFNRLDSTKINVEGAGTGSANLDCASHWTRYEEGVTTCSDNAWTTGGGDYYADTLASFAVTATGEQTHSFVKGQELITYFENIIDRNIVTDTTRGGSDASIGNLIMLEETGSADNFMSFYSEDNGTASNRPTFTFKGYWGVDNTTAAGGDEGRKRKIVVGSF